MRATRIILLSTIVYIACACTKQPSAVAFRANRIAPLMVQFTNLSNGYSSYLWDFGDNSYSTATDPKHTYQEPGKYIITLTAESDGKSFAVSQTVNLTTPEAYIKGVVFYTIPYDDRFYKAIFRDDALLPSSWDFQTEYTPLLKQTYLPYQYTFTPRLIRPDIHDYYTIEILRNSTTTNPSGDIQCTKQQLRQSELLHYLPEYLLKTNTGATAVGILMQYHY